MYIYTTQWHCNPYKFYSCSGPPPPPSDPLYADPNAIEHQTAPGTGDEYAVVDRKLKKKQKQTYEAALYQVLNLFSQ